MTPRSHSAAGELLRGVLALSPVGVLAFDRDLTCSLWNGVMEQISGLPESSVIGKPVFDLFPFLVETGEDRRLREALEGREASSTARPFRIESTRRSGFFNASYGPWRDGSGAIVGGIAIIRDVTAEIAIAQRVAESENRFEHMADSAPVLLWMARTDGMCTFFNQTWLDFTGRTQEEEWGVGWAEGVYFEDLQRCMDTYVDAFNRREPFEMEYRLRRRDGLFRWVLDRGSPRHLPDGSFAGFIGSCVDITERKQLEQDLRQAVRSRDEFLSIASHELRTPLSSLQLQLESLLRTVERADLGERAGRIEKNAETALERTLQLGQLVGALLDVSSLSEGKIKLDRRPTELGAVIRDVVRNLESSAVRAGCAIEVHLATDATANVDRRRVQQVVTNVLANAIRYAPGSPIEIGLSRREDHLRIVIADHGPGIPEEYRARVFDRFARIDSATRQGGFGLGLWIAREIVLAHQGSISIDSPAGRGSTFAIELPLTPPEARDGA